MMLMLASSSSELVPSFLAQRVQQVRSIPQRWPGRHPHWSPPIQGRCMSIERSPNRRLHGGLLRLLVKR